MLLKIDKEFLDVHVLNVNEVFISSTVFSSLPQSLKDYTLSVSQEVYFPPKSFVYHQEDQITDIFVVVQGLVEIIHSTIITNSDNSRFKPTLSDSSDPETDEFKRRSRMPKKQYKRKSNQ